MRHLEESREEFNNRMTPYVAIIIQKDKIPFDDEFFRGNYLVTPSGRLKYTPPVWAGARYTNQIIKRGKKMNLRHEVVPEIDSTLNYLICDEYSSKGETFEITIIRLLEQGALLDNVWCISYDGNREIGGAVLDTGLEWHNYRTRQTRNNRKVLQKLGYEFPEFQIN